MLDAEVICSEYNAYRKELSQDYIYEMCDLQGALEEFIKLGQLDGKVIRVSERIVKVDIF